MPWRLIGFVLIFAVLLVFIGFNLNNKCDINFGFKLINEVPVYLTVFTAFLAGMFCALPLFFKIRSPKKSTVEPTPKKKPQKLHWKKDPSTSLEQESSFSDGGPYGIN